MTSILMRSWRNRQTRTVEGRVREGMGSSPFDRTIMKLGISTFQVFLFLLLKKKTEERVHAGEFLRLLKELDPDEEKFYAEGAEEVEEEIEKLKK